MGAGVGLQEKGVGLGYLTFWEEVGEGEEVGESAAGGRQTGHTDRRL